MHQREDFKSENERLKSKVEQQFKEIEKYKLEARQQRRAYQPGLGGNLQGTLAQGLQSKLNLGRGGAGYTPGAGGMFQTNRSALNAPSDADPKEESQRYSSGRFNLGNVEKSMEFKLAGQGGFTPSSQLGQKVLSPSSSNFKKMSMVETQSADQDEHKNQVSTPESSKEDAE
jgi:hypothetical protein